MTFAVDTSGLHPSTRLAILALGWLAEKTECHSILDMGCGSGVLSATAAHIWPAHILAVDISPQAITDTRQVIHDYGLSQRVSAARSDRFAEPAIQQHAPYDLIIANMLDQWLVEMATDIKKSLKTGGFCLLSGLLEWIYADTLAAYTNLGFEIQQEFQEYPWRAAVLYLKL